MLLSVLYRAHIPAAASARQTVTFLILPLLALIASAVTTSAQSFSLPTSYTVGANPNSVTAGDFNGDGKPDLAIANLVDNNVSVLLNNGDGTFQAAVNYAVDLHPQTITVGDFNNDGKLDLAVGNYHGGGAGTGNISILLGNGNGTFQAAVNYDARSPADLNAVDLNGDGKLDLVAASTDINGVSVLLGNGNGTFGAAATYAAGAAPGKVSVADFNADGKPDLIVSDSDGNPGVSLLLGNGNGSFQSPITVAAARSFGIAAGDLNGDGKQDFVAVGDAGLIVFLGNGNGTFQGSVSYPANENPSPPVIGDLNGDGKPDLAVGNYYAGMVSVLRGNGNGTFQPAIQFPAKPNPTSLILSDFNTDGKPDLAVSSNGTARVNVLLNSPSLRAVAISATAGVAATVLVATLLDYDVTKSASSFTATINWGDSSGSTSGTVAVNGAGGFNVTGTHTYATAGIYGVNVQIADDSSNFAAGTDTATVKANQTITFGALGNKTFGDAPFAVGATSSSGLAVSFSLLSGPATISGNMVSITGAGTVTVRASQSGDGNYNAATPVDQSLTVNKATTNTALSSSVNPSAVGQSVTFTATVASGAGTPAGTVQFKDNGANIGTAQTLNSGAQAAISTSSLTVGTHLITADYSGDANFAISNGSLPGGQVVGSTIQFSSSTYSVTKGDPNNPRVNITVTRGGDTSGAAAVGYATIDDAGLTNCNVFNGTASPRCDYENTMGTLTWAAGDASPKTFSVAIVADSYAKGNITFRVTLSNPSGVTLSSPSIATITILDNPSVDGPNNPIDNTNFFVRQQYLDFLGREPDPPGFAGWTSTINNCSGDTTQCDRIHVSQLFFQSAEFQDRGYFVYRFYPVAFGRKPDYGEFVPDLASVSGFLDANQLEAAKVAFIAGFMARPAFASTYNGLSNSSYVDTLINTAQVNLSNRQALIDGLNSSTLTRAQVLRQIVESTEVSTKYNHQAYAVMEYFGYLRRQPDGFYLQWIQVLDQSNDPRGMVTGFVNSAEYRQRFGP